MVIVGRIATAFGGGRNAGEGQFLWPRRPPIIGHYQTLQTMVIVGRIALPLGTWTKAVGAGGTIGTDRAMHHLIPFLSNPVDHGYRGSDCTAFGAWTQCR